MHEIEFLIGLLMVVALLTELARRINVPYPVVLLLGGLGLGFIPGLPKVQLEPDLVFLIFLPPLLYAGAFFSSPRDLRAQARPIGLLAIGLVVATLVLVAVAAHAVVDHMSWPVAFTLGAIVSATDPIAATSILRRAGAPQRLATILEGESLVNDGTSLVAYTIAVAAVVTGDFSAFGAAGKFVVVVVGGVAVGLAVGVLVARLRRRLQDAQIEITVSLLTPFAAYIPASELGVSGVLAVVAVGLYLGWQAPGLFSPGTRLQSYAFWDVLVFLLNSVLFVLVGLQAPLVLAHLDVATSTLILDAAVVAGVCAGVRLVWMFTVPHLVRALDPRRPGVRSRIPVAQRFVLGWSGMRGALALAAALALPLTVQGGGGFPQRDLLVFLALATILVSLAVPGLTLPFLLRALRLSDAAGDEREEAHARVQAAHAALSAMEDAAADAAVPEPMLDQIRELYQLRINRFQDRLEEGGDGDGESAEHAEAYHDLRRRLLGSERDAIVGLRDRGELPADVMRRIERDIDLEESRLEG